MLAFSDLLRIVYINQSRRLRFGVVAFIGLGAALFILIHSVGRDIEERIIQDVSLLGNVTILSVEHEEYSHAGTPPQHFTADTAALLRGRPEVRGASLCMRSPHLVPMRLGERNAYVRMLGVDPYYWDVLDLSPLEGRLLTPGDEAARARVCVLGTKAARQIFGDGPYAGRKLTLYKDNYTVVGVVDGLMLQGREDRCFIPLSTAADRSLADNNRANALLLRLHTIDGLEEMYTLVPELIRSRQPAPHLRLEYPASAVENVRRVSFMVRLLLLLGTAACLGLGGFGIWQSSSASVRDRTREIGLKLAIGAERRDITLQFLGEALCTAFFGGLAGIALGVPLVLALCAVFSIPVPVASLAGGAALALSSVCLLGAAAGVRPSMRAGRMDAAEALRFE